jgi:hypothetical protein
MCRWMDNENVLWWTIIPAICIDSEGIVLSDIDQAQKEK